jgi:CheY-like chemotaxis protein
MRYLCPPLGAKTILCCDDEVEICKLLSEEIESAGYHTICCYSGNQAIRILSNHKIDLVLSDMKMPDGDGLTLLQHIREKDSKLPAVFIVTAYTHVSEEILLKAGAQAIFHKPIDMERLIEAVHSRLNR